MLDYFSQVSTLLLVTLTFNGIFSQTVITLNQTVILTVKDLERGLGRDWVTMGILRHTLHLSLISFLPHRLYPQKGASLKVRYQVP